MKHVKTRLHTKMEDGFLANHLIVYIDKEIDNNSNTRMILNEFNSMKDITEHNPTKMLRCFQDFFFFWEHIYSKLRKLCSRKKTFFLG